MFRAGSFRGKIILTNAKELHLTLLFPQDVFKLLTPGGGGYGLKEKEESKQELPAPTTKFVERGSVYEFRSLQESA